MKTKRFVFGSLGAFALTALLTACPGPTSSYMVIGQGFTLRLPPGATDNLKTPPDENTHLRGSLLWYDAAGKSHTVGGGYVSKDGSDLYISRGDLDDLVNNPEFLTPFLGGETADKTDVQVSQSGVKTGNLYPVVWRDLDGDGTLSGEGEVVYDTHDVYSYASAPFSYSFSLPVANAVERGQRAEGWSHVEHVVLEPSAAPGTYQISMNSVADLSFFLHEPSAYASSQSLRGNK